MGLELMFIVVSCFLILCIVSRLVAKNVFIWELWLKLWRMRNLLIKFMMWRMCLELFSRRFKRFRSFIRNIRDMPGFCLGCMSMEPNLLQLMILWIECRLWIMEKCSGQLFLWVWSGNKNIQTFSLKFVKDSTKYIGKWWLQTLEKYFSMKQQAKLEQLPTLWICTLR